ncbi:Phosphatidate cytidylyltransferase, mitochondrial [Pseudolycoriella hygida]|uniref:Phosphatidate cytidylyltransferase, mitochondrial n=1 Tax=Pseudolycoriella hygida TaxID=35572 RepID=A0A9Q0RXL4_9DIPT|nr:Phosphatidate cytidylyltransferase, mitochondrial [Pseudolycoriella hygida]
MLLRTISSDKWNILSKFPKSFSFCFAYGSGVKKQLGYADGNSAKKPMIDLVFCVNDSLEWHRENLHMNPSHYSAVRFLGSSLISKIQTQFGARVYCNTLVPLEDGSTIKYGVVTASDLNDDLVDWTHLYLAGRLHKPVEILYSPGLDIQQAIARNFTNALHVSLLLLPERFTYFDLFYTIANLSYAGDFRMIFGENKDKVRNIVTPQLANFRELYSPTLKCLTRCITLPNDDAGQLLQDKSDAVTVYHLQHLPKTLEHQMFGDKKADETFIKQLSKNSNLPQIVQKNVNKIVWNSSVFQSLKNIPTAGLSKAIRYSWKKDSMLSDSDSSDSDNGIRFKTTSTRNKESYSSSRTNGNNRERDRTDNSHSESRHERDRHRSPQDRRRRSDSRERKRRRSNSHDRGNKVSREHSNRDRGTKEKSEKDRGNRDNRSRERLVKDRAHREHVTVDKPSRDRSTVEEKREKRELTRDDPLNRDRKDLSSRSRTGKHSSRDRSTREHLSRERDRSIRDNSRERDRSIRDHSRERDRSIRDHSRERDRSIRDHSRERDRSIRDHSRERDRSIRDNSRDRDRSIRDHSRERDRSIRDHSRERDRANRDHSRDRFSRDLLVRENSTRHSLNDIERRHSERRRSESRPKKTESRRNETVVRVADESLQSGSVDIFEKSVIVVDHDDGDNVDKHKSKKVKHKKHKRSRREDADAIISKSNEQETLPTSDVSLSPEKKHDRYSNHKSSSSHSNSVCGPTLPPHMKHSRSHSSERKVKSSAQRNNESNIPLGPALPPSYSSKSTEKSHRSERRVIGPSVPSQSLLDEHAMSDISDSEDDDLIGPLPIGVGKSEAHLELEKRALELKLAKYAEEEREKDAVREEWMIELPEVKAVANLGLGARKFRTKERPDMSDRSSWTDTPKERERKSHKRSSTSDEIKRDKKREADLLFTTKRDAEQEDAARRHSKKHHRSESLLELHQKKMKKKREKEPEKPTRRPFDRDADLKVNRFDKAQKNSIIKKAQLLDTRFGSGESKYL